MVSQRDTIIYEQKPEGRVLRRSVRLPQSVQRTGASNVHNLDPDIDLLRFPHSNIPQRHLKNSGSIMSTEEEKKSHRTFITQEYDSFNLFSAPLHSIILRKNSKKQQNVEYELENDLGIDAISQRTLLQRKKDEMKRVDEELAATKEMASNVIARVYRGEKEFKEKQKAFKKQIEQFQKFILESDKKREIKLNQIEDEKKLIALRVRIA